MSYSYFRYKHSLKTSPMKKNFYILAMAVMTIISCQQSPKTVPVDTDAVKATITALADQMNSGFKAKDVNAFTALFSPDILICGTDPSEFWDKKQLMDYWAPMVADTTVKMDFSTIRREIKVAADGESAIVIEHAVFADYSPKMIIRSIYHVEKTGENWMIGFYSWNIVLNNEYVPILSAALQ